MHVGSATTILTIKLSQNQYYANELFDHFLQIYL